MLKEWWCKFHQYQQYEQPAFNSNNWTQHNTTTYGVGNPGLCLEYAQIRGVAKPTNNIPPFHNWISNDNGIFLYEIADFYFLSNTNNVNNINW